MKKYILPALISSCLLLMVTPDAWCRKHSKEFYELKIYRLKNDEQVMSVDSFLKDAYLPALHRYGISKVGVFKPIANDTAVVKSIYVLVPLPSADGFYKLGQALEKDAAYTTAGKDFMEASFTRPPFVRLESVVMEAFDNQPKLVEPALNASASEKVYELRSYESATDQLFKGKVHMFNTGDETGLFKRLGFNAIFYASVISGSHMPNLMYMTSFESLEDRNNHWKVFSNDPQWKTLSAKPEYQNTVSHADITLMHAASYSDL
ncbi:MAG: NIPSNAP family protein [Chitinophagaceae bacterium]